MMTITYPARNGIYVNMTNRCPCACTFCLRHNKDHVFDSDSLWLEREPTVEEVCDSIAAWDLSAYDEIVFCGYGEPTERLYDLLAVAKYIREKHPNTRFHICGACEQDYNETLRNLQDKGIILLNLWGLKPVISLASHKIFHGSYGPLSMNSLE